MSNIKSTLDERGSRYGDFCDHAEVTQDFKAVLMDALATRDKVLPPIQQEALEVIFHKIGRIINGDNNYVDSWHDISGYATLVEEDLSKREEEEESLSLEEYLSNIFFPLVTSLRP
jgi:hypothetical protein